MTHSHRSIDELIASYLEAVDNGLAPDWQDYAGDSHELRQQFERFIQLSAGVDALAIVNRDAGTVTPQQPLVLPQFSHERATGSQVHPPEFGPFSLKHILGRGGMGVVYVALHRHSGERVALKLLTSRNHNQPMYRERLRREAVAISSLEHPNIVSIVDSGVIDGAPYLATTLIDGIGVDQGLELLSDAADSPELLTASMTPVSRSPISRCVDGLMNDRFRSAAKLGAEIAEALAAAHEKQVIHRDVKPSNILIDIAGHAWLTDFGLAALGEGFTELTQTGDFLGTPAYMSPEQTGGARRSVIDHRTDIYSLGATLYEIATGHRPFVGTRHQILHDIAQGNIRQASKLEPRLPNELQGIISRAMATHPSDRYPTAAAMADDLRAFWRGAPVRVRRTGAITQAIRWCERNPRGSLATLVGVIVSVAAAFVVQAWNGKKWQTMNESLADVNQRLTKANQELDASQRRLSRELYVADVAAAYEAFNDGNISAVRGLLARNKQNDQLAAHRGTAWKLLNSLTAAPASVELCRHDGEARQLAIAADGSFGLSAGHDGAVRRFSIARPTAAMQSAAEPDEQSRLEAKSGQVFEIGGKLDALAMDSLANVFITGKNIPEGFNEIGVFDLNSGQRVGGNLGLWNSVESIAVSPSNRWIASADRYQDVVVHDHQGKIRGRWKTESRNEAVAFVDDQQLLATVQDDQNVRSLELWDIDTDQTRRIDCPFQAQVVAVSRHSDTRPPRYLIAADSAAVGLFDWPNLKLLAVSDLIAGRIRCIDISRDGRVILAGCDDGTVACWKVSKFSAGWRLSEPQIIETRKQAITDIKLLPTTSASDTDVLDSPTDFVTSSAGGSVECWRLPSRILQTAAAGPIHELIARPLDSQHLYLVNQDGAISRLNLQSMALQKVCQTDHQLTGRGVFSSDGKRLIASAADGLVDFDIEMSRPPKMWQVEDSRQPCRDLVVCGDQVFALFNTHLIAYDLRTGERQHYVEWSPANSSRRLGLHPDETTVVVVTQEALYRLEAAQLVLVERTANAANAFVSARFSSDGKILATTHANGAIHIRLWSLAVNDTGAKRVLIGHQMECTEVWFLDEDRILASSSLDGNMRFWDIDSGRSLGSVRLPSIGNRLYPLPDFSMILTYHGGMNEISAWRWREE